MKIFRTLLVLLIQLAIASPVVFPAENGDEPATEQVLAEENSSLQAQHNINLEALINGSTMQIRMDAASVMLFSDFEAERESLVDVLSQDGNAEAKKAICRMFVQQARAGRDIAHKDMLMEPLVGLLYSEDPEVAQAAAEALLIYPYEDVGSELELIAQDSELDVFVRKNAIEALKFQPDMEAVFALLNLVDSESEDISKRAEQALHSLDIPIGQDKQERQQIIEQIRDQGREEFLRAWELRREMQQRVQSLQTERDMWRKLYMESLDRIYRGLDGETARSDFLSNHLNSAQPVVRMWALGKVSEWRMGTDSRMPTELGSQLVSLVSDHSRDIRLKTAELLAVMGDVDSAEALLAQLEVEDDPQVRVELFGALGQACYYSYLTDSQTEVSAEVRDSALGWAEQFLDEDDSRTARKGADVIRKLLEHNGLDDDVVARYMEMLAKRYERASASGGDNLLRSELLSAMSRLCRQSVYKTKAEEIFHPVFTDARSDEAGSVREAAIEGLISIDRQEALALLGEGFVNESRESIRLRAIELAGEIGNGEDIQWLSTAVGGGSEGDRAWQVMLGIFRQSSSELAQKWLDRFIEADYRSRLSDEQMIDFLDIAQRRAVSAEDDSLIMRTREKLSELYAEKGEYDKAVEHVVLLREATDDEQRKTALLNQQIELNLRAGNAEAVKNLIANQLLENDLGGNDKIIQILEGYFDDAESEQAMQVLAALENIDISDYDRPEWDEHIDRWSAIWADSQTGDEQTSENSG